MSPSKQKSLPPMRRQKLRPHQWLKALFDPTHELPDPSLAQTQKDLSGLSEKVRDLTRQLGARFLKNFQKIKEKRTLTLPF